MLIRTFFTLHMLVGCDNRIGTSYSTPSSDFTDNRDGTVTHKRTGLVWQRCSVGQLWSGTTCLGAASSYAYNQALVLTSTFAGHNDWRLPNANELASIVKYDATNPAVNQNQFPNTPVNDFWSSSLYVGSTNDAWYVSFEGGTVSERNRDAAFLAARLVRGQWSANTQGVLTPNSFRGVQTFTRDTATFHLNAGQYRYYFFPKQANVNTVVNLAVTSGDCDLYGNPVLAKPSDMLGRQSRNGNGKSEQFSFLPAQEGYYYVLVKAVTACNFAPPTANSKATKLVGKHTLRLARESTIGIISTGTMDLQGMLLDNNAEYVTDLDHANHISRNYQTFKPYQAGVAPSSVTATNFMITPGAEKDVTSNLTKRRVLPVGDYHLLVSPDVNATGKPALDTGQYGILVLKRPDPATAITAQSNDFFTGLKLLTMDDSDETNNYMDIYVRSLYPHLVSINWGSTFVFLNVPRERQCKALNNFYLMYVLNNGGYMNTDANVRANWSSNAGFSLLGATGNVRGTIVYNSYTALKNLRVIHKGDIFAKDRGTFNHYGLYFENARINSGDGSELTQVIDANGDAKGTLKIVPASTRRVNLAIRNSWKVARPIVLQ